jgi:hypothetical protein
MSDPNRDWLDDELSKLQDIEAPSTLLPNVMREVRKRAASPWWARAFASGKDLWRSFMLAFSVVVFALSLAVNPSHVAPLLPGSQAVLNLSRLLLDTVIAVLLHAKVFNYPLLQLLGLASGLSYILLIAAASAIQRLADIRK